MYEFRVNGSLAHLRLEEGRASVDAGVAARPDVVMTTDVRTFVDLGLGRLDPAGAVGSGRLRHGCDTEAIRQFLQIMESVVERQAR